MTFTFSPGVRLGGYEIVAKIGEGGMGEVYRARDLKLGRDVAIKVLPQAFSEDVERLARFEREAKLLAQLHHTNIASIFGIEESNGVRALVMELVEGPDLAERLKSGSLPWEESLQIARQIAEALEEAHERGIIHRDLKPQNIKAPVQGRVKVLDFGLAKAADPTSSASGTPSASLLAASPTLTLGATVQGMILGTAAYMAPEQAKGMGVDKRADIWAFGVVLYEMLTGSRLFNAPSVPEVLALVLTRTPDLEGSLPPSIPPAIRRLLRRCLERNPKNRLHDIADARLVIDEILGGAQEDERALSSRQPSRWIWGWAVGALVLGTGLGALVMRGVATASGTEDEPLHAELEVVAPAETSFLSGMAVSPDGRTLAFVARGKDGRSRLWLRPLAATAAQELPGTIDARYPFWAPDGRRLGFFAQRRLKVMDVQGGSPRIITETGSTQDVRGGAWNTDDLILFTPTFAGPIFTVSASGGEVLPATEIPAGSGIGTQRFPSFLPDQRRFVYFASSGTGVEPGTLFLGRLGSLEAKELGPASSAASFVRGHLVYVQGDDLVAHRFDDQKEELVGRSRSLGISLPGSISVSGQRSLAISDDVLFYRADKINGTRLDWVDRRGELIGSLASEVVTWHYAPRLSPDDQMLVVSHYEPGSTSGGIWVHDLVRNFETRLTEGNEGDDTLAVWSPDGREVAFSSMRLEPPSGIFRVDIRQPGRERLWISGDEFLAPSAWLAEGSKLIYQSLDGVGRFTLAEHSIASEGTQADRALGSNIASEWGADVSPDGRWLAYVSDATRRVEVYVRSLAGDTEESSVRVSIDGGNAPVWRGDGKELFYLDDNGRIVAVPFESLDPPRPGTPVPLFVAGLEESADRQYDVTGDGRRFILNRTLVTDSSPIAVVLGWERRLNEEASR